MSLDPASPSTEPFCLNPSLLPSHVGIIMDGNGRWAQARRMPRTFGHRQGLEATKRIVRAARNCGIQWLSLYTFSTENWKRAEEEVSFLMGLILHHLRNEYDFYRENQVRLIHSGDIFRLPIEIQQEIHKVMADTAHFTGLTVNLAINYGGRDEIIRSVRSLVNSIIDETIHSSQSMADFNDQIKQRIEALDEIALEHHLDLPVLPNADLIIRTGGEKRLSNFLLWKSAYAELVFSDRLWPEWGENDLKSALFEYQNRQRRFGGTP